MAKLTVPTTGHDLQLAFVGARALPLCPFLIIAMRDRRGSALRLSRRMWRQLLTPPKARDSAPRHVRNIASVKFLVVPNDWLLLVPTAREATTKAMRGIALLATASRCRAQRLAALWITHAALNGCLDRLETIAL
ncbi:uncharacterized protein IWZ02DRAFT_436617 [Phyllosticta citriasiana]|uniref:uncharacterized protein n=1 Tax=Phyllosticta citriasiana TaxID=595635 RepID=UPI0030FDE92D